MKQDKDDLAVINERNLQSDLTYFQSIWNSSECQLRSKLAFLRSNWEIQIPFNEDKLKAFQDLTYHKIQSLDHYEKVFPQLDTEVTQLERVNEHKGKQSKMKLSRLETDELFTHFIEDATTRKNRNGIYYIKTEKQSDISKHFSKKPLHEYIAQCQHFRSSEKISTRWHNLFSRIENSTQFVQLCKPSTPSEAKQSQRLSEFMKEIEKQRLPALDCLGCCPFFYAGINIYNPGISSTPLVLLSSVAKFRQLQTQLKDEICWLLNNHGGVIMFDCATRYMDVVPVGDTLSRQLKVEISQTIQSYIKCIQPPVQAANYSVTFVPIIKNPLTQGLRQGINVVMEGATYETTYFSRQYVEGVYVTRIKIIPTVPERVYFWVNDQRPIFPQKVEGKAIATPGHRIHRLLKRRFKNYYVAENTRDRAQLMFMRPQLSYFHEGECKRPQSGVQITESRRESALLSLTDNYTHLSLVLARRCDLQTIKQRLQKRGITCQIETKFERYKFKYALNSAVLYHNMRFDLLLKEVAYQKEFEFAGKFITILCVTPFIKLLDRGAYNHLPEGDFLNIQNYFGQEYPQERIKLWKYTTQQSIEFYFKVSKPMKTVFLYYILNQLGQKASLKNPKNFDKLSAEDINQRFKLHYPREELYMEAKLKANLKQ